MPPGLFGLFMMSFGWFWSLLLIPTLAVLLRKLDHLFRYGHGRLRESALALCAFSVILAFRGDDSSALYFVISTFLLLSGWTLLQLLLAKGKPVSTVQSSQRQDA